MSGTGERTTEGRGKRYSSILDTIGNTPVVHVKKLVPYTVRLYVKAEFFNPAGQSKIALPSVLLRRLNEAQILRLARL
jgi:cysteine synthase A|tara:strand:+ start:106 stop:339 length:234 start_codon:yes stop_codon:yes gene_type:complete